MKAIIRFAEQVQKWINLDLQKDWTTFKWPSVEWHFLFFLSAHVWVHITCRAFYSRPDSMWGLSWVFLGALRGQFEVIHWPPRLRGEVVAWRRAVYREKERKVREYSRWQKVSEKDLKWRASYLGGTERRALLLDNRVHCGEKGAHGEREIKKDEICVCNAF